MKKNILNLGKALQKTEQKQINGGNFSECGYSNIWKCRMSCGLSGECQPCHDGYICDDSHVL